MFKKILSYSFIITGKLLEWCKFYQGAIFIYKKCLFFYQNDPQSYFLLCKLGDLYRRRDLYDSAGSAYKAALKLNSAWPKLHYKFGEVKEKAKKWNEAAKAYKSATRLDPQYAVWHFKLGNALEKTEKWNEAAKAYKSATRLDPQYAKWHFKLGNALKKTEKWDEAVKAYNTATRLDPQYAKWHFKLSNDLGILGGNVEAIEAYKAVTAGLNYLYAKSIVKLEPKLGKPPLITRCSVSADTVNKEDEYDLWNDRHLGNDIFLVGSSNQLNDLSMAQKNALKQRVVIGGNNTYYQVPLTYFLSAYLPEVVRASYYLNKSQLIKLNNKKETFNRELSENLTKASYDYKSGLNRYLTENNPFVNTLKNQVLAMTHLAIIMGAKRIIYIGVDQRNHGYFWQKDSELVTRLRQDLHKVQASRYLDNDFLVGNKKYFDNLYRLADEPSSIQDSLAFYQDFTDIFRSYFYDARNYGVEPIATLEGSVVHLAGARLLSLDEVLGI